MTANPRWHQIKSARSHTRQNFASFPHKFRSAGRLHQSVDSMRKGVPSFVPLQSDPVAASASRLLLYNCTLCYVLILPSRFVSAPALSELFSEHAACPSAPIDGDGNGDKQDRVQNSTDCWQGSCGDASGEPTALHSSVTQACCAFEFRAVCAVRSVLLAAVAAKEDQEAQERAPGVERRTPLCRSVQSTFAEPAASCRTCQALNRSAACGRRRSDSKHTS